LRLIKNEFLGKGNNETIVRQVMMKRSWWSETVETAKNLNFRWQQTTKGIFWERYSERGANDPIAINHFEFIYEIGTKDNLMKNLIQYCDRYDIYVYNFVPITMEIKLEDNLEQDLALWNLVHHHIKKFRPGQKVDFDGLLNSITDSKEKAKLSYRKYFNCNPHRLQELTIGSAEKNPRHFQQRPVRVVPETYKYE
jgi:hypothetical protein